MEGSCFPGMTFYDGLTWKDEKSVRSIERVKGLPLTQEHILVSTYPKSGTTWMCQIVWLVMNEGHLPTENIDCRVPFLDDTLKEQNAILDLQARTVFKTHFPYRVHAERVANPKSKFIIVMRNIKDCLVSYYNMYKMNPLLGNYTGSWDEFFELFKQKRLHYGDWLDFNMSWWQQRYRDNVLIVYYEDMTRNLISEIEKVAIFCGKSLSTEYISDIAQQTTFENMRRDPMVSHPELSSVPDMSFMRKGIVGDWKKYFTTEQKDYISKHYESHAVSAGLILKDLPFTE